MLFGIGASVAMPAIIRLAPIMRVRPVPMSPEALTGIVGLNEYYERIIYPMIEAMADRIAQETLFGKNDIGPIGALLGEYNDTDGSGYEGGPEVQHAVARNAATGELVLPRAV